MRAGGLRRSSDIARLAVVLLAGALVFPATPAYARISRPQDPYGPIIEFPDGSGEGGSIDDSPVTDTGGADQPKSPTDARTPVGTTQPSVGSLGAGGANVRVTAVVTEEFALTIRTDGALSFGNVKPGHHYSISHVPLMRVQSNKPWVLTDSSAAVIEDLGGRDYDRARILKHYPSTAFNRVQSPGAYEVQVGYVLNLSDPSLRGLPEDTVITADMGYTVIQL